MSETATPGDVHAQIQIEAAVARNASAACLRDSCETPALAALLDGANEAIAKALPAQFEHEGRTYWLRCTLGLVQCTVFDNPMNSLPLVEAILGNAEECGHVPAH